MVNLTVDAPSDRDLSRLLALNNAAVPHVNGHDEPSLLELFALADFVLVARRDGQIAGFLVAFAPGSDYRSANYRWFDDRQESFCYVDRVVVAPAFRCAGVGRRLYDEAAARTDADLLTCEVNLRPPNPVSAAFHRRLGFRPVGEQDTAGGEKRVELLARRLAPADRPPAEGPRPPDGC